MGEPDDQLDCSSTATYTPPEGFMEGNLSPRVDSLNCNDSKELTNVLVNPNDPLNHSSSPPLNVMQVNMGLSYTTSYGSDMTSPAAHGCAACSAADVDISCNSPVVNKNFVTTVSNIDPLDIRNPPITQLWSIPQHSGNDVTLNSPRNGSHTRVISSSSYSHHAESCPYSTRVSTRNTNQFLNTNDYLHTQNGNKEVGSETIISRQCPTTSESSV